jgi:hypothetical protein
VREERVVSRWIATSGVRVGVRECVRESEKEREGMRSEQMDSNTWERKEVSEGVSERD